MSIKNSKTLYVFVITIVILFSPSMIVCTCITKQLIIYQDFNFIPIQLIVKPTRTLTSISEITIFYHIHTNTEL